MQPNAVLTKSEANGGWDNSELQEVKKPLLGRMEVAL